MPGDNVSLFRLKTESDLESVSQKLNTFVNHFKKIFSIKVILPKTISSLSPDILFANAAEIRGNLDTIINFLLVLSVFRLQVKIAQKNSEACYKEELTSIYKLAKADIVSARGYEEKELLARSYMTASLVQAFEFWNNTLSDVDDLVDLLKLKMAAFKGGLDTILNQSGLLNIAMKNKGLVLSSEQASMLEQLRPDTEGYVSFTQK